MTLQAVADKACHAGALPSPCHSRHTVPTARAADGPHAAAISSRHLRGAVRRTAVNCNDLDVGVRLHKDRVYAHAQVRP